MIIGPAGFMNSQKYDNDAQEYDDGYNIAKKYCNQYKPTEQETYKIPCPVQWSEAKENGFYDAIADYRRSIAK